MAFCLSKNYSYLCYMGNWEKQQDEKKESRERDQSRRENLGKFFYDLAKLTFAGLVFYICWIYSSGGACFRLRLRFSDSTGSTSSNMA